jgi:hypothetical protein
MMEILLTALAIVAVVAAALTRFQPRQPEPVRIPVKKMQRRRR